jgi:hypothetical protein
MVTDSLMSLGAPSGDIGNDGDLGVGETWSWDKNYFITADDATGLKATPAVPVHTELDATANDPSNNPVTAHFVWDQFFQGAAL